MLSYPSLAASCTHVLLDSPTGGAGQQGLGISLFGRKRFVMPSWEVRITDIGGANIRFLPNLPHLSHMGHRLSRIGPVSYEGLDFRKEVSFRCRRAILVFERAGIIRIRECSKISHKQACFCWYHSTVVLDCKAINHCMADGSTLWVPFLIGILVFVITWYRNRDPLVSCELSVCT